MVGRSTFRIDRDPFRANLLKYTRMAWGMLPPMLEPRILDIACGSGIPTIELARLSGGKVIGLDSDAGSLRILRERAKVEGLEGSVETVEGSLFDVRSLNGVHDVVWAEGALHDIGFEGALREWRPLLRPEGYLVLHDEAKDLERKLSAVETLGYEVIGHFQLPDDAWWVEYYSPLLEEAERLYMVHKGESEADEVMAGLRAEAERCLSGSEEFRSVFMVLRSRY